MKWEEKIGNFSESFSTLLQFIFFYDILYTVKYYSPERFFGRFDKEKEQ